MFFVHGKCFPLCIYRAIVTRSVNGSATVLFVTKSASRSVTLQDVQRVVRFVNMQHAFLTQNCAQSKFLFSATGWCRNWRARNAPLNAQSPRVKFAVPSNNVKWAVVQSARLYAAIRNAIPSARIQQCVVQHLFWHSHVTSTSCL